MNNTVYYDIDIFRKKTLFLMIDTRQSTQSGSIGILPACVFEEPFGRLRSKGSSASEHRNAGEWVGRRSINAFSYCCPP